MKEDILEQIVAEYLSHRGCFVRHNIKFRPDKAHPDFVSNADSNHGDIDVLGYHPRLSGAGQVLAVSCKSWQSGFRPRAMIAAIEQGQKVGGKDARKHFRELALPKWSQAFRAAVERETGRAEFTHVTAVAHLVGPSDPWETSRTFRDALGGNPVRLLTFKDMLKEIEDKLTTTLAATGIGRMIQIVRAAKLTFAEV